LIIQLRQSKLIFQTPTLHVVVRRHRTRGPAAISSKIASPVRTGCEQHRRCPAEAISAAGASPT
jgi:hypothetical protein